MLKPLLAPNRENSLPMSIIVLIGSTERGVCRGGNKPSGLLSGTLRQLAAVLKDNTYRAHSEMSLILQVLV
jgi:hypothetical protein